MTQLNQARFCSSVCSKAFFYDDVYMYVCNNFATNSMAENIAVAHY